MPHAFLEHLCQVLRGKIEFLLESSPNAEEDAIGVIEQAVSGFKIKCVG